MDGGNIRKSTGARPQPRTGNLLVRPRIKEDRRIWNASFRCNTDRKKKSQTHTLQKLAFRKSLDDDSPFWRLKILWTSDWPDVVYKKWLWLSLLVDLDHYPSIDIITWLTVVRFLYTSARRGLSGNAAWRICIIILKILLLSAAYRLSLAMAQQLAPCSGQMEMSSLYDI